MPLYEVRVESLVTETYYVDADSPAEAVSLPLDDADRVTVVGDLQYETELERYVVAEVTV